MLGTRRYVALGAAFSLLFAAQGFLIGAAPDFISNVLGLPETDFAYLFVPLVAGAMAGALLAARKAGRWSDGRITLLSYLLMGGSCLAYVLYMAAADAPRLPWAVLLPGLFTCGLAMGVPAMTLRILGQVPDLSGTAASVLGFMQMLTFSVASGWGVPWVYGQPLRLAAAMLACVAASAIGWAWLHRLAAPVAKTEAGLG
ncbi:hypothetical protein [Achromobacter pulmonis]|uniref:hypothetical protein n=1 Tax=Achromobacter pulmonis TaxID=1389932 RepID=UPI003C775E41